MMTDSYRLYSGHCWYTNFRLYKRDVTELRRELQNALRADMIAAAREAAHSALHDFKKLQYQQLKLEAEKHEKDGFDAIALTTYAQMLDVAQSWIPEIHIPQVLDEIVRILKKESLRPSTTSSLVSTDVLKALEALPSEYKSDVEAIDSLFRSNKLKETSPKA